MKVIQRSGPVDATVTAPPSKSYSVRALLLAAMAGSAARSFSFGSPPGTGDLKSALPASSTSTGPPFARSCEKAVFRLARPPDGLCLQPQGAISPPLSPVKSSVSCLGAAPATMALTPRGSPCLSCAGAFTSRPCTMGAPQ